MHACTQCDGTGLTKWEPQPDLTVDMVVMTNIAANPHVLTVVRGDAPFAGRSALPGGYANAGETLIAAGCRELAEETGVRLNVACDRVGVYDSLTRDPRGHVISVAFLAVLPTMLPAVGGDDAASAEWQPVRPILAGDRPMAFDHADIIADAHRLWQNTAVEGGPRR